uniref:Expressed protein n=1 Tax=Oryza sativa subsp. japonica TaxID=39947 RepID=Q2QZ82_ORYSJ|nr:expressed protein [Oryza sativa Japonica Group]
MAHRSPFHFTLPLAFLLHLWPSRRLLLLGRIDSFEYCISYICYGTSVMTKATIIQCCRSLLQFYSATAHTLLLKAICLMDYIRKGAKGCEQGYIGQGGATMSRENEDAFMDMLLLDPIENRYKNEEVRAQATRDLSKCIVDHRMAAKSLPTPEQYAVERECTKAEQWLWERSQLQESLPKNVDPALWFCRNIARHKGSPARADSSGVSDHMHKTDRG